MEDARMVIIRSFARLAAAVLLAVALFGTAAQTASAFRGDWNFPAPAPPPSNEGPCRGGRAC